MFAVNMKKGHVMHILMFMFVDSIWEERISELSGSRCLLNMITAWCESPEEYNLIFVLFRVL
jgi:hypothetical protein